MLEFRRDARRWLEAVRKGERLLLTYRGEPVARLEPVRSGASAVPEDDPLLRIEDFAVDGARTASFVQRLIGAGGRLVSTDYVLDESYTLAKARSGSRAALALMDVVEQTSALESRVDRLGASRPSAEAVPSIPRSGLLLYRLHELRRHATARFDGGPHRGRALPDRRLQPASGSLTAATPTPPRVGGQGLA